MEPKLNFDQIIRDLEQEVEIYLIAIENYQFSDEQGRKMIEMDGLPEMPPYLVLYRKLKVWSGKDGLNYLWEGAYMDQPYISTRLLEAIDFVVKRSEARYEQRKQAAISRGS